MKPKAPSAQIADVRSPSERALAESQAQYFSGLMEQPNFGYQSQTEAYDPLYEREFKRFQEMASGAAAERGFGSLRHGPTLSLVGRGAQEMSENRAAQEAGNMENYRKWVISGGRQAATPTGRTAFMTGGSPSAFSMLAGPLLGAAGYGMGGPIGGAIGGGIGSMFSQRQQPQQYSPGNLFGSPGIQYT